MTPVFLKLGVRSFLPKLEAPSWRLASGRPRTLPARRTARDLASSFGLPQVAYEGMAFHGGQEWQLLPNFVEDLSVTTNGLGPPEAALAAAREAVGTAQHYPPMDFEPQRSELARFLWGAAAEHATDRLLLGNGASELIDLLTRDAACAYDGAQRWWWCDADTAALALLLSLRTQPQHALKFLCHNLTQIPSQGRTHANIIGARSFFTTARDRARPSTKSMSVRHARAASSNGSRATAASRLCASSTLATRRGTSCRCRR